VLGESPHVFAGLLRTQHCAIAVRLEGKPEQDDVVILLPHANVDLKALRSSLTPDATMLPWGSRDRQLKRQLSALAWNLRAFAQ
jgi:hypothetical protein